MYKKWLDDLLLIADFIPGNPNEFESFGVDQQVQDIKELGFNVQHIEVNDITVGEAGVTFFESAHAIEQRKDQLKNYRSSYEKHGGHDLVYFNVHWLNETVYKLYPEWFQTYHDQKMIPIPYGSGGYSCINSTFRNWVFNIVKDIGSYGVKGVFLDGPVFSSEGCYCSACLEQFEVQYGFKYTPKMTKDRTIFQQILDFKHRSIANFVKDAREALQSVDPDAMIYINSCPLGPDTDGRNNRMTMEYQDALLAEGGFLSGNLNELPIWKPQVSAKLLETQADGKPTIVALAGRHGPWTRYLLTAPETWLVYAQTVANGGNVWYGIYDTNRNDKRMEVVRQINTFLMDNQQDLSKTKSKAKIGLVWSSTNANYYQTTTEHWDFVQERMKVEEQQKSDARKAFNGWIEVLNAAHHIFDIIDEYAIRNTDLSQYELLIFPNTACMSEKDIQGIRQYINYGGHMIATYDTGFYDELGRGNHRETLKEIVGIEETYGTEYLRGDHIEIEPSIWTKDIEQRLIPAPQLHVKVKPTKEASSYMFYRQKQPSVYCDLPPKTDHPFLISHQYGKGKVMTLTSNIDAMYETYRFPEYLTILNNLVENLSTRQIQVEPRFTSLQVNLRGKEERLLLHVVNYTAYNKTRPIQEVIVLQDVQVAVAMQKAPKEVEVLKTNQVIPFKYEDGFVKFSIPQVHEYEIIRIDTKYR